LKDLPPKANEVTTEFWRKLLFESQSRFTVQHRFRAAVYKSIAIRQSRL